jgi:tRNA-Thr(GGU) m(6)t(6)A37 methyltransferase TsaA
MRYTFETIGTIHSCFKEKFGIPRQPGLAPDAWAVLELTPPFSRAECLRGLESYSHLWIVFVFHAATSRPDKSTVRPPRLGGNRRVGVFGSRSNFRPNPIGLSVCELERIAFIEGQARLYLTGVDILDQTPVIDIKPYLPYADARMSATAGWSLDAPAPHGAVCFSPAAEAAIASLSPEEQGRLRRLISQVLSLDPRPAYHHQGAHKSTYGMRLDRWDVRWEIGPDGIRVNDLLSDGQG